MITVEEPTRICPDTAPHTMHKGRYRNKTVAEDQQMKKEPTTNAGYISPFVFTTVNNSVQRFS